MRILVVEDDKDLNRQLCDVLKDQGYVVDTAFDGENGHFYGDTEPYDAVILDIGLPVMDGISVLERWRKDGRKMPVLMLTSRSSPFDRAHGALSGSDIYLTKPITWDTISQAVDKALMKSFRNDRAQMIARGYRS